MGFSWQARQKASFSFKWEAQIIAQPHPDVKRNYMINKEKVRKPSPHKGLRGVGTPWFRGVHGGHSREDPDTSMDTRYGHPGERGQPVRLSPRTPFRVTLETRHTDHPLTGDTPMKALLITPDNQTIEEIEISGMDDIKRIIGYDTIESDAIGSAGDRLFFDEECFLRGTSGRFQIDTVIPVSGKGIIVGASEDASSFSDVTLTVDELEGRLKYL